MARIRTIKPEFWTSEQVADCSPTARLLFIGMWNFCDDYGIHIASTKRLKMEVFPGDTLSEADVSSLVAELIKAGLVRAYVVTGIEYWIVTGWHHQKIDKPNSKYPQPEFADQSTTVRRPIDDESPPEGKGKEGKGKEGNGKEGNGKEGSVSEASCSAVADQSVKVSERSDRSDEIRAVFDHYRSYHPKAFPSPASDSKEWRAVRSRLKEGYSAVDLCSAIDGCHVSPWNCGENPGGKIFQDLELIVRNGSKVNQFIEANKARAGPVLSEKTRRTMRAAQSFLDRMNYDGDAEERPSATDGTNLGVSGDVRP